MGQNTTKTNGNHNGGFKKDREQLLQEFNLQREKFIEALQSTASSAILPNGLFPAEIIDMILRHFEDNNEQFQIVSCCKLWLSVFLPKAYDWFVQRRFARPNIANGLFWPSVLMLQCFEPPRNRIACDWSMHNDTIILNKWSIHNSWDSGDAILGSHRLHLPTNKLSNEDKFGTFYINNIKVLVQYLFSFNALYASWESITCYKEDGSSFEIEFERDGGHGDRFITCVANMDGSDQIMLFDRVANLRQTTAEVEHKIETFDLTTGDRLDSLVHSCFFILGFWKHYVISYGPHSILSFCDLKTGVRAKNWKLNITVPCHTKVNQLLFVRNDKMAICENTSVHVYDLNNDSLIKSINILESNSFKLKRKQYAEVVSVSFDNWKLVTVTHIYRWHAGGHYHPWVISDQWLSIFDITNDYRHLNTIKTLHSSGYYWPIEILLPTNGKILINAKFSALLEIDFLHPNLMKNTIKILQCHKNNNKGTIKTLSPLTLTEYLLDGLNTDLGSIAYTTYFVRDPQRLEDIFDLNRSQQKRITFIYPINKSDAVPKDRYPISWKPDEEFERYWEIRPDYFSCLQLTTLDLSKCHQSHNVRFLPEHLTGDILFILFEEFDPQTNQWLICDPFVAEGTQLELREL